MMRQKIANFTRSRLPFFHQMIGGFIIAYRKKQFVSSKNFWDERYKLGGNSGTGSYGKLALFKARILNEFVVKHSINSVIEFGCGDGHQLTLARYPHYLGLDISQNAIDKCKLIFSHDSTKVFYLINQYDKNSKQDLALSLDVIYHLVEDDVYHNYMQQLFDSASKFVIIYSSNTNDQLKIQPPHVVHRKFSDWVGVYASNWHLFQHIPNEYPFNGDTTVSSFADFFIYERI